tara:strand:- start:1105 stop:1263 length:159 start_codon:yes stop_codon:yes gene_type:complete
MPFLEEIFQTLQDLCFFVYELFFSLEQAERQKCLVGKRMKKILENCTKLEML